MQGPARKYGMATHVSVRKVGQEKIAASQVWNTLIAFTLLKMLQFSNSAILARPGSVKMTVILMLIGCQ